MADVEIEIEIQIKDKDGIPVLTQNYVRDDGSTVSVELEMPFNLIIVAPDSSKTVYVVTLSQTLSDVTSGYERIKGLQVGLVRYLVSGQRLLYSEHLFEQRAIVEELLDSDNNTVEVYTFLEATGG
ncbi:hypothetical protein TWF281_004746 [Arthrobotrys megalospora]